MILVDWQIREEVESGRVVVDPFDGSLINPASLDFRLGRHYTRTKPKRFPIDPTDKSSFETETWESNNHVLEPGDSILVSMLENLTLPNNISAKVYNKSSLARLGIENSPSAGFVDCGWSGIITLELFNVSRYPVRLTEGMKAGQLILLKHETVEKDYSQTGRYRFQAPGFGSLGV